jgi:hypothetical protein
MNFSVEHIEEIIKVTCGDPPEKKLLEHSIEVNEWKLKFEKQRTVLIGTKEEHAETIATFETLIKKLKEKLNNKS